MIEDLKQVRDALSDSKVEFWDDWHSNMSEVDFENHWLIMDIDKSLATLDRIIDEGVVVPDGYKLVPIDMTDKMFEAGLERYKKDKLNYDKVYIGDIYEAMLSAAPTPAKPEKLDLNEFASKIMDKYLVGSCEHLAFGDGVVLALREIEATGRLKV